MHISGSVGARKQQMRPQALEVSMQTCCFAAGCQHAPAAAKQMQMVEEFARCTTTATTDYCNYYSGLGGLVTTWPGYGLIQQQTSAAAAQLRGPSAV